MLIQFKSAIVGVLMQMHVAPGSVNLDEVSCMAYTVYQEASNQNLKGKLAVANTVKNRLKDKKNYPRSVCKIVKQRSKSGVYQYSYWYKPIKADTKDTGAMKSVYDSIRISLLVLNNIVPDNTNGATSFINMKTANYTDWVKRMQKTVVIQDHTFLKAKPRRRNA